MTSFINFPFLLITSNSMSFIEYLPMMGSAIGLLAYKNWKWSLTGIPCVALYIFIILIRLDKNLYLGDSAPDIWVRANYINLLGGFTASFVFACVLVAFSVHCMRVYINKVEHLNRIDYLTGCYNKATYNKILLTEKINKKDITFLGVLDIDFFKKVNDELGHQAGDTALVVLSHILQEIVSDNLQVYRFGGEEFVLLTNMSESEFFKKVKKLWNLLDSHFIISERPLTVSIGITKTKGIDSSTWFDLADAQMYEAKHAGRHCVYYNSQKVM